jgi:hypothetical protein
MMTPEETARLLGSEPPIHVGPFDPLRAMINLSNMDRGVGQDITLNNVRLQRDVLLRRLGIEREKPE